MARRAAALGVFLALATPATGFAIPSVTVTPTTLVEGTSAGIDLFFNVFPGDVVTAGGVRIVAGGGTTFTSSVEIPVGGTATIGIINSSSSPADYGAVFGPNCGAASCALPVGAHLFARLTVSAALGDGGSPLADLLLESGVFVQAPFCEGVVSNNGAALVSVAPVPEPTSIVLVGVGLASLVLLRRRLV